MTHKPYWYFSSIMMLILFILSSCVPDIAPPLTDTEKKAFQDSQYPFAQATLYANALEQMGKVINDTVPYRKNIQPMEINNTAGGKELPFNLTNIVINSVSYFSGPSIAVVPHDPTFTLQDAQTGGKGTRLLPDILIGGSITEFDKDIEGSSSSIDLDILISHHGTEMDSELGGDKSSRLSRVVLDLYLLDYETHAVIPGGHVSNTVHVMQLDKNNNFGFAIWGSGMGIEGEIMKKQGFHKAVRNLVEYSILQLFGKYYGLPYWKLLGMKTPDRDVLRSLHKTFKAKSRKQQVYEVQKWLARYKLAPVINHIDGRQYYRIPTDGVLSPLTVAFIDKYKKLYAPAIKTNDMFSIYRSLVENGAFPNNKTIRSPEEINAAHKALSSKMGKSKDSDTLILIEQ